MTSDAIQRKQTSRVILSETGSESAKSSRHFFISQSRSLGRWPDRRKFRKANERFFWSTLRSAWGQDGEWLAGELRARARCWIAAIARARCGAWWFRSAASRACSGRVERLL